MTWTKILQLAAFLLWPVLLFGTFWLIKNHAEVRQRIEQYRNKK